MAAEREPSDESEVAANEANHSSHESGIRRRDLLRQGATAALGVGVMGLAGLSTPAYGMTRDRAGGSKIRRYKSLGKTGLKISDISFGSGALKHKQRHLLLDAYDRGINYFDTADGYPLGGFGGAEKDIGTVLGSMRKEIVIATKAQIKPEFSRLQIMQKLDASLDRLKTDYVDIYFNHAVNDLARIKNDEWLEFVETAKRQGKIRFSGMSGHGGNLIECLDYAIDNDLVDVILTAHNFGQDPAFYERFTKGFDVVAVQVDLPRVFIKAHAKGIGVIAMKTLMGAKLNDLRPYEKQGGTFAQAAFRWVLSNPNLDALIVTMDSPEKIEEYVKASGSAVVTAHDVKLLQRYVTRNGSSYCRHGCDVCTSSCSYGVPIPELLRTRMYATDYQNLEMARGSYLELGDATSACLTCTTPTCLGACPVGIDIPSRTRTLHKLLQA